MTPPEYYHGLPKTWTKRLHFLSQSNSHLNANEFIWRIQNASEKLPITASQNRIAYEAREAAKTCYRLCEKIGEQEAIIVAIEGVCEVYKVGYPGGATNSEKIKRAVDSAWWNRKLRKEVARRFEQNAIEMGFTGIKTAPYISNESALTQLKRNVQNAKLLERTEMENEQGQSYKMSELAALGPANKEIRRGELMMRIRGFEEIAKECKHIGQFWTITCPSEFHSVGGENLGYAGKTPREAQAYLVHAWALMRSRLARQGLKMYGFRIAEPHTDGCPHWHMLLFVGPTQQPEAWHPPMKTKYIQRNAEEAATRIRRVITVLSRAYAPHEKGAKENRVKLIRIEAGKGTAAGYIAKYVAKNIDGANVGEHKTKDGYTIIPDMLGKQEITPSQRVTFWSQLHGIRQFQQIGGAPIGTWRELRRIKAETVQGAPEEIRTAWRSVQKIVSQDPAISKQADFAEYVRVQGGPFIGRAAAIQIAKREEMVEGRYTEGLQQKPCGVFLRRFINAVYESVRYRWKRKIIGGSSAANPGRSTEFVALPWTGVNNCTQLDATLTKKMEAASFRLAKEFEVRVEKREKNLMKQFLTDWHPIAKRAREIEKETWKFSQLSHRLTM